MLYFRTFSLVTGILGPKILCTSAFFPYHVDRSDEHLDVHMVMYLVLLGESPDIFFGGPNPEVPVSFHPDHTEAHPRYSGVTHFGTFGIYLN